MRFEETVVIAASPEVVYERAADLEGYSDLAEEYKESRVISRDGNSAVVERKARIAGLPLAWRSKATLVPSERIEFEQISGPLRGMHTVWQISRESDGTRLSIIHELAPGPAPIANALAGVIYRLFVRNLALKILANLKALMEADAT